MNIRLDNCFFIIIISSNIISKSPVHLKDSEDVIALITHIATLNKVVGVHEALK